jgi:integrase
MLAQALEHYLAVRRAAGFKLKSTEQYLRYFVRFAHARGDAHVRGTTAIEWAAQAAREVERQRRYLCVRRFARFMQVEEPRHEIPPESVFCGYLSRPSPYIFTNEELHRLLHAAAQLGPLGSLRPHTYTTLFTLLAVTGLRPTEAYALCRHDLTHDGLVIRDTKFGKSRLVPIHPSTRAALERYLERRNHLAVDDDHVFVTLAQRPLSACTASRTFRQLLRIAGLPDRPGRPRVYDLRHRFATRALQACSEDRDHVGRHMLALSTYLGHGRITSTYWYLETTPQLMTDIAARSERVVWGTPS